MSTLADGNVHYRRVYVLPLGLQTDPGALDWILPLF